MKLFEVTTCTLNFFQKPFGIITITEHFCYLWFRPCAMEPWPWPCQHPWSEPQLTNWRCSNRWDCHSISWRTTG